MSVDPVVAWVMIMLALAVVTLAVLLVTVNLPEPAGQDHEPDEDLDRLASGGW